MQRIKNRVKVRKKAIEKVGWLSAVPPSPILFQWHWPCFFIFCIGATFFSWHWPQILFPAVSFYGCPVFPCLGEHFAIDLDSGRPRALAKILAKDLAKALAKALARALAFFILLVTPPVRVFGGSHRPMPKQLNKKIGALRNYTHL